MLSRIFHYLINVSYLWYFIISVVLALMVIPIEKTHNSIFIMTRLASFVVFYLAIILFSSKIIK